MKILVTGDRNWTDRQFIYDVLYKYGENMPDMYPTGYIRIVHGAARGVDSLAGEIARSLGYTEVAYPAQWNKHGKAAGPIRNQQMLDEEQPDLVIAFHDDLENSKGTKHMVAIAKLAGIKILHYRHGFNKPAVIQ